MSLRVMQDPWERFVELLGPIHDRARLSARRLSRSVEDGDDLFHETLLRAYRKLPALRDPERFPAWFYAVLLSVHRNRSRRSFWRRFVPLERAGAEPFIDADDEGARRMSRALGTLPAAQREAIVLSEIDGYSMEEIAGMQEVTVSAVKSRISRGRLRLRRHYERLGFGPMSNHEEREGPAHG